jgi:hypothetical protein
MSGLRQHTRCKTGEDHGHVIRTIGASGELGADRLVKKARERVPDLGLDVGRKHVGVVIGVPL